MAFRVSYSEGKRIKHSTAWQCYFCSKYYARKEELDDHIEICTGLQGYVYNFNTLNLFTFEENLKYNGNTPLVAYIDFKTISPTNQCLDSENRKMFAVSYVIIFAFTH